MPESRSYNLCGEESLVGIELRDTSVEDLLWNTCDDVGRYTEVLDEILR